MSTIRDMVGYGNPPHPNWPNRARVALQFVINHEEGGENCILNGDAASEAFLSEIVGAQPLQGVRHLNMESIYEFGSRAGVWRLLRLFNERNPYRLHRGKGTRDESRCRSCNAQTWSRSGSHGYRWIDYQHVPEAVEREHIEQAIDAHKRILGERPLGFASRTGLTPVVSA